MPTEQQALRGAATVPKLAEENYLSLIGDSGRRHSLGKPFSDDLCGINLAAIGTIMALLPKPPGQILDMGCGGGWSSIFFAKRGYKVVGQDISQDMIDLATENMGVQGIAKNLSFVRSDYESTTFENQFDAVVFYDSLHHAEDERAALASAYRALKSGGVLITHEPGEGHAKTAASIEAMRRYGVTERDMPPRVIVARGRELGFTSSRIYPMQHDIFAVFYMNGIPRLFSKNGYHLARRVLKMAFNPCDRTSSIVVMKK